MQRAKRAGRNGHRLPAHHVRAAALSGPVEGRGVLARLLAHHSGHLAGDPHGWLPALKTSARGASNPNARLVVRICTTPLLLGSFPAKLTSNQYRVESPDRSEPTTARRNFPTPALPAPS